MHILHFIDEDMVEAFGKTTNDSAIGLLITRTNELGDLV